MKDKYGEDKVTAVGIITYFGIKLALREVCRYYRIPVSDANRMTAIVGNLEEIAKDSGEDWHDEVPHLPADDREFLENYKKAYPDLFEKAERMVGLPRQAGKHAAGYVISPQPLAKLLPIRKSENDEIISQFDKVAVERMGFLKADILGLRNLTTLTLAAKYVKQQRGVDVNFYKLVDDPDDIEVWEQFDKGRTLGVFQMEGCLAGDTLVSGRKISKLYEDFANGAGIKTTTSYYLDEGKAHRNKIVNMVESGVKQTYRLVSESGRYIEATAEHRFMTQRGWVRLGELVPGEDSVLVGQRQKSLWHRECIDCGAWLGGARQSGGDSTRCYACSARFNKNPSKEKSRRRISERAKEDFRSGARKPVGFGETKETSEAIARRSKENSERFAGRNLVRESMSEEEYRLHIEKIRKANSGTNNFFYGKGGAHYHKRGYREDIGISVRSSWEADYIRVLNHLGVRWEYEPKTFELVFPDGSKHTYTPDFYLPEQGEWVEVKGYMRDVDALKIRLLEEQHGICAKIVDKTKMAEFEMKYSTLENWECPNIPEGSKWERVVSIYDAGEQMTYDIEMTKPANNFLANGFMVHNSGITGVAKELKPRSVAMISIIIALYRPGVIDAGMLDEYIARAKGEKPVEYVTPLLRPILEETYGVIVFQEQAMAIFSQLAGFTPEEADHIRAAIGKKKMEKILAEKPKFIQGCARNGVTNEEAEEIFRQIEASGRYSFNQSHSYAYATISFWTAYMKAHYPLEYYAASMSTVGPEKAPLYMQEARRRGIKIVPPVLSNLGKDYTLVSENEIAFGLTNVRGIGPKAIDSILENAPYDGFEDFVNRSKANAGVMKSMILCGAFREIYPNTRDLMMRYETNDYHANLFGESLSDTSRFACDFERAPFPDERIIEIETELFGMPLTIDPFDKYRDMLGPVYDPTQSKEKMDEAAFDTAHVFLVKVQGVRLHMAKNGMMAFVTMVTDKEETIEAVCFSDMFKIAQTFLREGRFLRVEILKRQYNGKTSLQVNKIQNLEA